MPFPASCKVAFSLEKCHLIAVGPGYSNCGTAVAWQRGLDRQPSQLSRAAPGPYGAPQWGFSPFVQAEPAALFRSGSHQGVSRGDSSDSRMAKHCLGGLSQSAGSCATISDEKFSSPEKSEMAYVIAEPCIGTKDTACVDACPVDCIHPKKDEDGFADARPVVH